MTGVVRAMRWKDNWLFWTIMLTLGPIIIALMVFSLIGYEAPWNH